MTPSVPFYVTAVCGGQLRDSLRQKMTALPLVLVDDVLSHGSRLKTLDMSEMRLGEDYELAIEDVWSRVTIRDNQVGHDFACYVLEVVLLMEGKEMTY